MKRVKVSEYARERSVSNETVRRWAKAGELSYEITPGGTMLLLLPEAGDGALVKSLEEPVRVIDVIPTVVSEDLVQLRYDNEKLKLMKENKTLKAEIDGIIDGEEVIEFRKGQKDLAEGVLVLATRLATFEEMKADVEDENESASIILEWYKEIKDYAEKKWPAWLRLLPDLVGLVKEVIDQSEVVDKSWSPHTGVNAGERRMAERRMEEILLQLNKFPDIPVPPDSPELPGSPSEEEGEDNLFQGEQEE